MVNCSLHYLCPMKKIDQNLINAVGEKARLSPRRRMNHNFHPVLSDPLQRLLNVMEPLSYIRPHKHENPDKVEAFILLKGRMVVVEFNTDGSVADHILLDPLNGNYGVEIAPRTFHTIIALESGTTVYEVKNGPYDPIDDKNFASWAPLEGDPGVDNYLNGILARLGYQ